MQAIQLSDHFTRKRLLRFSLPSIVMMVFTSVYGVVDGYFVSNYTGKTPFAAVNLVMPFLMVMGSVGFMFGTGGGALIAKTMGEGKAEKARELFSLTVYASIVCVTKKDSPYASATSIADLAGGKCTAQIATIWYDQCLPQIQGAQVLSAAETAPAMLMALETGSVDFICTDMPTAQGAVAAYPDMTILDFSGTEGDFQFSDEVRAENVNIGVSVKKGNTELKNMIDAVLSTMTQDDMNALMQQAIAIQPLSE